MGQAISLPHRLFLTASPPNRLTPVIQDIRYTLRTLRRDTGFVVAAVLIIALGIGVNTTIFSVANTVLFRPLDFQASDRLAWIANTGKEGDLSSVTSRVSTYLEWRSANRSK